MAEPTASGARIDIGEAAFTVRQRYRGQSDVEHAFVFWGFSLLHASQHGFADAGAAGREESPLNIISMMARRTRATIFICDCCTSLLYNDELKKQRVISSPAANQFIAAQVLMFA